MKLIVKQQASVFKVEIDTATDHRITLKVTVFVDENHQYTCDIERQDSFRLKPSFHDNKADEEVYVTDLFFKISNQTFCSPEDLKTAFLAEIREKFASLGP